MRLGLCVILSAVTALTSCKTPSTNEVKEEGVIAADDNESFCPKSLTVSLTNAQIHPQDISDTLIDLYDRDGDGQLNNEEAQTAKEQVPSKTQLATALDLKLGFKRRANNGNCYYQTMPGCVCDTGQLG